MLHGFDKAVGGIPALGGAGLRSVRVSDERKAAPAR